MRCSKCKLQYVGKANTEFNLQINKYRKDILKSNAILAVRHLAHKAGADSEILKRGGGALYVGHDSWSMKKVLAFR